MSAEATSAVVITLDLVGQKAAIAGLTATTDAIAKLAAAVTAANDDIVSSTSGMAAKTATAYQAQADEAEAGAARVASAIGAEVKSNEDLATTSAATADAVAASYAKMGASANLLGVRSTAALGRTGAAGSGTGILGLLTSMRTLVTGGIVYESIKFFDSYQTALVKLGTQAGLTSGQIAQVSRQIQSQAVNLRTTPSALAGAYYNPISEGWSVTQSANVVARAAQLANMSGAPLAGQEGTSYTLSTMMQTMGMKPTAANALKMAAMIRGGVSSGDLTLTQLQAANSTGYFNAAQSYGINEQSAMGNLAFFSSQGVSPQSAATRMRMTLAMMSAPTQQSQKYLTQMGLTTTDITGVSGQLAALGLDTTKMAYLLRTPNGINAAVQAVVQASSSLSPEMREALYSKLFGGGRSEATFLSLANHPALANQMYQRVGAESTTSGYNAAVATYNKTISASFKELAASGESLGIALGQDLIPVLSGVLGFVSPLIADLAKSKLAVGALATVLGGSLVLMVGKLTLALGSAFLGALSDVAGAVGGTIVRLVDLAGAETAEGSAALVAAPEMGAFALSLRAVVPLLLAFEAGQKIKQYGQQHPQTPFIGSQWLAKPEVDPRTGQPVRTPGGGLALHGPSPLQYFEGAGQGLGRMVWTDTLSKLFSGLGLASGGFVTNRPTAIVGEGNPAHPEFVIPTDPAYRARALGLYSSLGTQLMADGGMVGLPAGASDALRRLVGGQSLGSGQNAMRAIDDAVTSSLPSGIVRSVMLSVVSTVLGAVGRGIALGGGVGGAGGPGGPGGVGGSVTGNQAMGQAMAAAMGWTGNEWTALQMLWQRESGWSNTALNPRSGAYGIAQALPASKYPFAGQALGGSSARSQINWGLDYIRARYGDPVAAMAHETAQNWYAKGGVLPAARYDTGGFIPEGLSLAVNHTGAPEFVPGPGSGGGGDLHVHLEVDGRQIAQATIKDIRRQVARR